MKHFQTYSKFLNLYYLVLRLVLDVKFGHMFSMMSVFIIANLTLVCMLCSAGMFENQINKDTC